MLIQLIVSVLLFLVILGINTFILQSRKIDYFENFPLLLLFHLISTALVIQLFSGLLSDYLSNLNYILIIIPLLFVLGGIAIDHISDQYLPIPPSFYKKHIKAPLLRMNYKMIFTKLSDILFQDIMILIWVLLLYNNGWGILSMTILFLFAFPILHTPLILVHKGMSMYYIGFSFLGFALPFMLLNIENGLFYVIAAHFFTYIIGRVGFGLYFKFKKQKYA